MARKPKVYAAEIDGLHEWIVAARNQAEALEAFGVNQDLFKQGLAGPAEDPKAVTTAMAEPGKPLRRIKGSKDPFRPADTGGSEAWSKAAKGLSTKGRRTTARPKRDRKALERAQAELERFDARSRKELQELDAEMRALERRREGLLNEQEGRRKALRRALDAERRGFERQG